MSPMYYSMNKKHRKLTAQAAVGRVSALFLLVLLLPVALFNLALSLMSGCAPLLRTNDPRGYSFLVFQSGWLRDQWALLLVACGDLNWFDETSPSLDDQYDREGLVSERKLHALSGLSVDASNIRVEQDNKGLNKAMLLLRYGFAKLFYASKPSCHRKKISLFGIEINNLTMVEAVEALLSPPSLQANTSCRARTACFVNVNSFNLASKNIALHHAINRADIVLADGSGVRLAAQRKGTALAENVNGTDLLPYLCREAVQNRLSVFLLGGAVGVADAASAKLSELFPGLKIVGSQHGYFSPSQSPKVIEEINNSNADIVLVALGSPVQELWLEANKHRLNARVAIAVGGLLDFFSGRIPRAPMWLRELGLEWVWRLMQEPKAKFKRYVLGNPAFLYRILRHKNAI